MCIKNTKEWKHLINAGVTTCQTTKGHTVHSLEFFEGRNDDAFILGVVEDGMVCGFYTDGREQYWIEANSKRKYYRYGDLIKPENIKTSMFIQEAPDWVSLFVVAFFLIVAFAWLQIFEGLRG